METWEEVTIVGGVCGPDVPYRGGGCGLVVVSWRLKDGRGRLGMDMIRSLLGDLSILHG